MSHPQTIVVAPSNSSCSPSSLPQFNGVVYSPSHPDYDAHRYQYAFSSHSHDGSMKPAAIIYPKGDDDIFKAIEYATRNQLAIAVRTGGHQYSGASSTSGRNIQLDLSQTYPQFEYDPTTRHVRTGVSHTLAEFNTKLGELGLFVPHGQCSHVHIGGHLQTGGYGQLARAFGLFSDHVISIEVITADCKKRVLKRNSTHEEAKELFFGFLGGSPGNFGIVTHFTIQPHHDAFHPDARGFKALYIYNKERLRNLTDLMTSMVEDENFPADFDFCITFASYGQNWLPHIFPRIDEHMRMHHQEQFGHDGTEMKVRPPAIFVFAQYSNLGGANQQYDPTFFNKIKAAGGNALLTVIDDDQPLPMSKLTREWVFGSVREFELPYEKSTRASNSKTLRADGFVDWLVDRIEEIQCEPNGCKGILQLQHFGGKLSKYRLNDPNDTTAYSWRRDTNLGLTFDAFYDNNTLAALGNPHLTALKWQERIQRETHQKFCKQERRVLWGSFGDKNMCHVWSYYYENEEKYKRLCAAKARFDPNKVFTPNSFCVGAEPNIGVCKEAPEPPPVTVDQQIAGLLKVRRDEFWKFFQSRPAGPGQQKACCQIL